MKPVNSFKKSLKISKR